MSDKDQARICLFLEKGKICEENVRVYDLSNSNGFDFRFLKKYQFAKGSGYQFVFYHYLKQNEAQSTQTESTHKGVNQRSKYVTQTQ